MMTIHDVFTLLLLALATSYWAYAIAKTHGAFGMFLWIRRRFPLGGLTDCPICLSFWLGILFYLIWLNPNLQPVVVVSAIAGAACALGYYSGLYHQR